MMESETERLAPYEQDLINLFGKETADYFVHPKIIQQTPANIKGKLRKQPKTSGAAALFNSLRSESKKKMDAADNAIPISLKKTYWAFLRGIAGSEDRQHMGKDLNTESVPGLAEVMDMTESRKTRAYRRLLELTHRSAKLHEDRIHVIQQRNPLPAILSGYSGNNDAVSPSPSTSRRLSLPSAMLEIPFEPHSDPHITFITAENIEEDVKREQKYIPSLIWHPKKDSIYHNLKPSSQKEAIRKPDYERLSYRQRRTNSAPQSNANVILELSRDMENMASNGERGTTRGTRKTEPLSLQTLLEVNDSMSTRSDCEETTHRTPFRRGMAPQWRNNII